MKQIKQLWQKFKKNPFLPSAHNNDSDLELLDSTIAGCISSLVGTGYLENKKMEILESYVQELNANLKKVPVDAQGYFKKLAKIGNLILQDRTNYIR